MNQKARGTAATVCCLWRRFGVALAITALWGPRNAWANKSGARYESCSGCHNGGKTPTVLVTSDATTVSPGQLLNLTISISQTNGPVAGFNIESGGIGSFSVVDSGTKLAGRGVTHTTPRTGSNGITTFNVGWTAPATPGGVDFNVWANSANGDGRPSGDAEGDGFYSVAFGCIGTKYFHDYDGDNVGALSSGYTVACSKPAFYAQTSDDCDDSDPTVFPGGIELCDGKDNNCNGQVDEGLPIAMYCTDADGDGHGVAGQATLTGCGLAKGFGLCDNDCNDADPAVYPGALETCNGKDDNCNGAVDEGARTLCGVGWCAKYAAGCGASAALCVPNPPRAEQCNDFDDDCDGVIDNGTDLELCGAPGLGCRKGYCVPLDGIGAAGGAGTVGSADTAGGASVTNGAGGVSASTGTGQAGSAPVQSTSSGCSLLRRSGRNSPSALSLLLSALVLLRRVRKRRGGGN